jgi:hypothetical protein
LRSAIPDGEGGKGEGTVSERLEKIERVFRKGD